MKFTNHPLLGAVILLLSSSTVSAGNLRNGQGNNGNGNNGGPLSNEPVYEDQPGVKELTGRVTVKRMTATALKNKGKSQEEIQALRKKGMNEIQKHKVIFESSRLDMQVLEVPGGKGSENGFIKSLTSGANAELYEFIEPDYLVSPIASVPNDPYGPTFSGAYHHGLMQSTLAWDIHKGSDQVVVAICDTGIEKSHPDLAANMVEGYNAVDGLWESQGGNVTYVHPHGTQCAGCAAGIGVSCMES